MFSMDINVIFNVRILLTHDALTYIFSNKTWRRT